MVLALVLAFVFLVSLEALTMALPTFCAATLAFLMLSSVGSEATSSCATTSISLALMTSGSASTSTSNVSGSPPFVDLTPEAFPPDSSTGWLLVCSALSVLVSAVVIGAASVLTSALFPISGTLTPSLVALVPPSSTLSSAGFLVFCALPSASLVIPFLGPNISI